MVANSSKNSIEVNFYSLNRNVCSATGVSILSHFVSPFCDFPTTRAKIMEVGVPELEPSLESRICPTALEGLIKFVLHRRVCCVVRLPIRGFPECGEYIPSDNSRFKNPQVVFPNGPEPK